MKFLFIGAHYPAFRREIEKLGHECKALDHWQLFTAHPTTACHEGCRPEKSAGSTLDSVNDFIREEAIRYRPDVLVQWKGWIDDQKFVRPSTVGEIKEETGCTCVYWSVDDPDFVGHWQQFIAMHGVWDIALTCCRGSVETYRKAGVLDPHYFLPAHDTDWPVDSLEDQSEAVDLVIAGHPYAPVHGADMGRASRVGNGRGDHVGGAIAHGADLAFFRGAGKSQPSPFLVFRLP